MRLWHGGVAGLRVGGLIQPGHDRPLVDGCKFCAARSAEKFGGNRPDIDPLTAHGDKVYLTTEREYARYHASLWGRGDLYRVEPVGGLAPSTEDTIESFIADAARVIGVYDRAVLLTPSQRRRVWRIWSAADAKVAS